MTNKLPSVWPWASTVSRLDALRILVNQRNHKKEPLISPISKICEYNRYYNGVYHNIDDNDDGFFCVNDSYKSRSIYICTVQVGRSRAFHADFDIEYFIDLVRTNDEHSGDLGKSQQEKVYQQLCSIALQIAECDGNICIFCGRGRTRSPVHIAAYLVVVNCYTPEEARSVLSQIFILHRGDRRGVDRDKRFIMYLERLVEDLSSIAAISDCQDINF